MLYAIVTISLALLIFEYKTNRKVRVARVVARRAFRRSCNGNRQRANKFTLLMLSIGLEVLGTAAAVWCARVGEYHSLRNTLLFLAFAGFVLGLTLFGLVMSGVSFRDDNLEEVTE
jgi:hypothetical protein